MSAGIPSSAPSRAFAVYAVIDRDGSAALARRRDRVDDPRTPPVVGHERGIDEVLALFAQFAMIEFKADSSCKPRTTTSSTAIVATRPARPGEVDTTWALVWHLNESGKVDRSSTCPVISIRWTR
jgi:uncharacterized protein